jgi:hypothetical protein
MANRLVSWADLMAFLEAPSLLESDDKAKPLALILDSMTTVFESYLGRTLSAGTYTKDYWGEGITVPLEATPVSSVTSVMYDGDTLASDEYDVIPTTGIRLNSVRLTGAKKITVVYAGGYSVSGGVIAVPNDIKLAALYQIVHEYKQKDKPGAQSVETNAGTISIPALSLLKYVRGTLDNYRHPWSFI